LSGVHSATVVGTGAYPTRTTLTFTPTAGSLTLTVTGTVEYAQLEAGSFATSYIPTTTTALTRSADVCSIAGADFSGFYNQSEGTMLIQFSGIMPINYSGNRSFIAISDGSYANYLLLGKNPSNANTVGLVVRNSTAQVSIAQAGYAPDVINKMAMGVATNDVAVVRNGSLSLDTTVVLPSNLSVLRFYDPNASGGGQPSGHIQYFRYYKKRLPDAKLQALTA